MKRQCFQCGRHFYDQGQPTDCCPKCCEKADCPDCTCAGLNNKIPEEKTE